MTKPKGPAAAPAKLPDPVTYPKSILVAFMEHGTEDQFLTVAESPDELSDVDDGRTVKVARYVLAGTGVIHNVAPRYIEDEKS